MNDCLPEDEAVQQQPQPRETKRNNLSVKSGGAVLALAVGALLGLSIPVPSPNPFATSKSLTEHSLCTRATTFESESPCLPRVIIGGAMKCGTNEAMRLLQKHPRVKFHTCPDRTNKTECNNENYQGVEYIHPKKGHILDIWEASPRQLLAGRHGILRYLHRLPHNVDGDQTVSVDKSPTFLQTYEHPRLPQTLRALMPSTRLVFSFCDPVERLVSEYYHYHRNEELRKLFLSEFESKGLAPPATLGEFLRIIANTSEDCRDNHEACKYIQGLYFSKGLYHRELSVWLQWYSQKDVLVLDMDGSRVTNTKQMLELAGLPLEEYPWEEGNQTVAFRNDGVQTYRGRSGAWTAFSQEMKEVSVLYAESNKALAKLLGRDFPLQWKSSNV